MSFVTPSVLPDEIALGYKGRLIRHNGWTNEKRAMQALLAWAGNADASRLEVSTVELLAKSANMSITQFVCEHTTLPLRRAIVMTYPGVQHGTPGCGSLLWAFALRQTRTGAYFCRACVEEDYDFHGTIFWRRDHQSPGRYWCAKHGNSLLFTNACSAFTDSPASFLTTSQLASEHWVERLQKSELLRRFLIICSDLMANRHPLDEYHVSRAARARAAELGLHTGFKTARKKPLVSDLIKDGLDKEWLNSVVPGLVDQPRGHFWYPIDNALAGSRSGVASVCYALVFAALYESADEAINAMTNAAATHGHATPECLHHPGIAEEALRTAYINARGSHQTATTLMGKPKRAVAARLSWLGLPELRGARPSQLQQVITAVLSGNTSLNQACAMQGISSSRATAILRQALTPLNRALVQLVPTVKRPATGPRPKPIPPPKQSSIWPDGNREGAGTALDRKSRQRKARSIP